MSPLAIDRKYYISDKKPKERSSDLSFFHAEWMITSSMPYGATFSHHHVSSRRRTKFITVLIDRKRSIRIHRRNPQFTMLRSSLNASRLVIPHPILRPSNPQQILSCIRQNPCTSSLGSRSMAAVAATSDGPLITPGTPISTPTLIDIDKRWLDLTAQQQLDIFKALHEREKEPWYTMTTEERKACTDSLPLFSPLLSLSSLMGQLCFRDGCGWID